MYTNINMIYIMLYHISCIYDDIGAKAFECFFFQRQKVSNIIVNTHYEKLQENFDFVKIIFRI